MLHLRSLTLKGRVFRYLGILLGCLISSSSINLFVVPAHLLSGGIAGIAMIFYYLFSLPIGVQMFLYNLPLLAAAYKTLGREYTLDIAFGTILFSFQHGSGSQQGSCQIAHQSTYHDLGQDRCVDL